MGKGRSTFTLRVVATCALALNLFLPILPAAAAPPLAPQPTQDSAELAPGPVGAAVGPAVTSAVPCGASVPSTEIVQLRTRTSRTYQAASGADQTVSCLGSVNYLDSTGAWQPIDNTLVASTTSGYAYQNAANAFAVLMPSTLTSAPIKVTRGSASVAFSLAGDQAASAATSGSTASYAGALPNVTASYSVLNDGLKENLTLANATAPSSFIFNVTLSAGLTAHQNSAGGVDFVDSAGAVPFSFAPPYATDSSNSSAGTSSAVSLSLTQTGSALAVTVAADPTWLASPSRVWPVVVDPQVVVNPARDCSIINGSYANTNYCSNLLLNVGSDGTNLSRSVLQFDVTSVPSNATILDSTLSAKLYSASGTTSANVSAMQLTQGWTTGVTWNTTDGTTLWTTAGGTFGATALDQTMVPTGGAGNWYSWGITSVTQGWVNGTVANDGVLLKSQESISSLFRFDSDRTSFAPGLTITYQPWLGQLPFWTYSGHGLTDRSDVSVNVANGNLVVHGRDLTIAGTGLPLSLDRFYNSLSAIRFDLGMRWQLDYGFSFHLNIKGSNAVVLYGPSGWAVPFYRNGSGGYITPPGIDADLVRNGDQTYTLTYHATGAKDNFNAADGDGNARLSSVVDKNGNTIALTYNGDHTLHTITDTQGRVVTFGYGTYGSYALVTSITDSTSRQVQYGYSTDGSGVDPV